MSALKKSISGSRAIFYDTIIVENYERDQRTRQTVASDLYFGVHIYRIKSS